MSSLSYYENLCFVIMPFGQKPVDGKTVDFNAIYEKVFAPAIAKAVVPDGNNLEPRRTDHDAFSGSINQDMFEYIMYSRMAIADISGSNANALYELGARHALQDAGTVILRQKGHGIPYDIQTIKVFEYDHSTDKGIKESRAFITKILTNSLERNRLDSPIRQALGRQYEQRNGPAPSVPAVVPGDVADVPVTPPPAAPRNLDLDALLLKAEEASIRRDWPVARTYYQVLLMADPMDMVARMKLGLVLKNEGRSFAAHDEFATLTRLFPDYAEAWREKGVIESLIIRDLDGSKRGTWAPHGLKSFQRATELGPGDADAWSSWGGLLRRIGDEAGALKKYRHAAEVSDGDPYPLLNAIKLDAKLSRAKKLSFDKDLMRKARDVREAQTREDPPKDTPWSFFDLAEMKLFSGDADGFVETLKDGLRHADQDWMVDTFEAGLQQTLVATGIKVPGLDAGLKVLKAEKARRARAATASEKR